MNELQRTQYLEDMGIDVFVPRLLLPAAKNSVQAALPEPVIENVDLPSVISPVVSASQGGVDEPSVINPSSAASVSGIVTNIMGALGGAVDTSSGSEKGESELARVNVTGVDEGIDNNVEHLQESVSFSLNLWRVSSALLVIDTHQPKQALPTAALLSNILFAKNIKQRLPVPEVLTWPMFAQGGSQRGWKEAGDMVNAFLSARLSVQPAQYIWLMGDCAFNAVFFNQNPNLKLSYSNQIGSALDLPSLSALALVLPSLTDMLLKPELKRKVWNTIRPYGKEENV